MSSKIFVSLTISGFDFEPEKITSLVGIEPSKLRKKGNLINPKGRIKYKKNSWCLHSTIENSRDISKHIESIFDRVQEGWIPLVEVCRQYHTEIECAIYIDNNDERPIIHLDQAVVKILAELNAEVDIDLYFLSEEV